MISEVAPPLFGSGPLKVSAWNGLVGLAGETLPIAETGATARFALASPPAADAWLARFRLAGEGPVFVHIRDFPFAGLFGVELGVADIGGLPDPLRQALLEGMFASLRTVLPAPYRDAILEDQGLAAGFPGRDAATLQWFDIELARPDGAVVALMLGLDRTLALRLLGDDLLAGQPAHGTLAARIGLPAAVSLGAIDLSLAEIGALETGGLVVLPAGAEQRIAIRVDNVLYQFERTAEAWRCLGARRRERPLPGARPAGDWGTEMTDGGAPDVPAGGEAEGAVPAESLRVAVDFDIGQLSIPVSALAQWQPGALVELGLPAAENGLEVTIRVNGEAIGRGDLVRIDDRLAVRINRLLLASKG